ncbi:hypothetical protein ACKJTF_001645 [Cronobacter sakazakii]|nr:hypothetical protein [Cronobacter sakazakii]
MSDATVRKANAYVNCHQGSTEERIDELLRDFFIFHSAELSSLLRMKYRQLEQNSSAHIPGIIEGTNDANTLYREFILNLMLKWTNEILPLRFWDDVISLTGSVPVSGSHHDRKKESCSDLNKKAHLSPASAGFFDVCSLSACLYCMKSHESHAAFLTQKTICGGFFS